MLCEVCKLVKLKGRQVMYCSKNCERKGWRDSNREKLLEGKRKYREANKESIQLYNLAYKKKVKKLDSKLSIDLRKKHNCLRCDRRENLEVHHIRHQLYGGGHNDPNNLLVLCKSCHALWHKMFPKSYWLYGVSEN
jgi:hypothetical protein